MQPIDVHQAQALDSELLGEQLLLQIHHVEIAVVRKAGAQSVARFAGLAVAHIVRQDQEILRCIERLAGAEELGMEVVAFEESVARAAGAVQDQHGVRNDARAIPNRGPDRSVVQLERLELFARAESILSGPEIRLDRIRILGGKSEHEEQKRHRLILLVNEN